MNSSSACMMNLLMPGMSKLMKIIESKDEPYFISSDIAAGKMKKKSNIKLELNVNIFTMAIT
jgi:hypothetical protein